ncbi:hypothetical protein TNCV_4106041 [Trichonephila clavipes]|nr:hypothetical protein TNCV_4106041 [Trichonephila clavipes]
MTTLEQFGFVEQSMDLASHLCILALQSLYFLDKSLAATIAASTLSQLCLYVEDEDLLLDMATQFHALRHIRCHLGAYRVF